MKGIFLFNLRVQQIHNSNIQMEHKSPSVTAMYSVRYIWFILSKRFVIYIHENTRHVRQIFKHKSDAILPQFKHNIATILFRYSTPRAKPDLYQHAVYSEFSDTDFYGSYNKMV